MIYTEVKIAWKCLFESLREHTIKIINFTNEKNEIINKWIAGIIWKCKNMLICKTKFKNKYVKHKKYCKLRDHCHYTGEYRGYIWYIQLKI